MHQRTDIEIMGNILKHGPVVFHFLHGLNSALDKLVSTYKLSQKSMKRSQYIFHKRLPV